MGCCQSIDWDGAVGVDADADHGAYGVEGREELICAYHFRKIR